MRATMFEAATQRMMRQSCFGLLMLTGLLLHSLTAISDEPPAASLKPHPDQDSRGRTTAVTLNYCRASFHRIRRYQSKRVMSEEQEKILNNLNLNGIDDEDVIRLYSQVLDEIGQIEIADRESTMVHDRFRRAVHRQAGVTAFAVATQMATGSIDGLVRTGVSSWMDYRDLSWAREFDSFKVEKTRMTSVVDKSSRFLDTFWKLSQSRNIPDRWLVRGKDLDDLEAAIQESDLTRRLRLLRRMESFMECYPPYWYFVARTQQGLGQLGEAVQTYEKVADLAHGHFRRDDMLAAAMANQAIIQEHLNRPEAVASAKQALAYSSGVWEANLLCAQVLENHGLTDQAEDAILRNLDSDLESQNSSVALLGLYYRQNRLQEMAGLLAAQDLVEQLPIVSLIQCLHRLGPERTPAVAYESLRQSLRVAVEPKFGADDVLVLTRSGWQADNAEVRLLMPGTPMDSTGVVASAVTQNSNGENVIRFRNALETGNPFSVQPNALRDAVIVFEYKDKTGKNQPVLVKLEAADKNNSGSNATPWWAAAIPFEVETGNIIIRLRPLTSSGTSTESRTTVRSDNPDAEHTVQRQGESASVPSASIGRVKILGIRPITPGDNDSQTQSTDLSKPVAPDPRDNGRNTEATNPVPPPPSETPPNAPGAVAR